MAEPETRTLTRTAGITETAWCRAVCGGTGTAVLALSSSKAPNIVHLQNALHILQNSRPILKSKLHYNPSSSTFSFLTSPSPFVEIKVFKTLETFEILNDRNRPDDDRNISHFHLLLEHELNRNSWHHVLDGSLTGADLLFVSIYEVDTGKRVVVFRLHVAACDRTTAVSLLEELLVLMSNEEDDRDRRISGEEEREGEIGLGIEDLVPEKMAKKPLLARGFDMINYSVNSLRSTNLKFKDVKSGRRSQVARLQMSLIDSQRILSECKIRGIKLSAVLVAAGLLAAQNPSSGHRRRHRKYGVISFIDCRPILDPPLSSRHFGFYHSAIMNSYSVNGGEDIWELAKKAHATLETSKKSNKHFLDMADLNLLMCTAIDNPSLTPSSSMRTALISVFENTVIDNSGGMRDEIGIEDYMGCASVHGVGPSVAVFDTVRDGRLDCICVYPAPLHSREQMDGLVGNMKALLMKG